MTSRLLVILAIVVGGCRSAPDFSRQPREIWRQDLPAEVARSLEQPATPLPASLTLGMCIGRALAHSEKLGMDGETYVQAMLERRRIKADSRPELRAETGYSLQRGSGFSGGESFGADQQGWLRLQLDVPVYFGRREYFAGRAATARINAVAASLTDSRNRIALTVAERYFAVLAASRRLETVARDVALRRERLDEIQLRLDAGDARRSDWLLNRSELARAEAELARGEETFELARAELGFLIDMRLPPPLTVPPVPDFRDRSPSDLLAAARTQRQDLAARALDIAARGEELQVIRGEFHPDVEATVSATDYSSDGESAIKRANVSAEWLVADGGERALRVRQAESRLRQAELAHAQLLRQLEFDILQTLAERSAGERLIAALATRVNVALETVTQLRDEYEAGAATNLELLTAQNEHLVATLEHETEQLRHHFLQLQLLAVIGEFPYGDL